LRWIRQKNRDDATFLSRVITGDVSWIYGYDPKGKEQLSLWESPNSPRMRKARQVRSKVKSMTLFFLTSRGFFIKDSSWQAKQSSPHTTVTFHDGCVKMCEDFTPNFGYKKLAVALRQRTVSHVFSDEK
jgi:hypothetical protein